MGDEFDSALEEEDMEDLSGLEDMEEEDMESDVDSEDMDIEERAKRD